MRRFKVSVSVCRSYVVTLLALFVGLSTGYGAENTLTREQQQKLEAAGKAKMTIAKAQREAQNGAIEELRQKVGTNAPGTELTSAFGVIMSDIMSVQGTEDGYWDTVAAFLPPIYVAKLFLKSHPPMNPTIAGGSKSQPPAAAQKSSPPQTPAQDWKAYFGATKEQQQKLDAANKAKNEKVKALHQQRNDQIDQLARQVEAASADKEIQSSLAAIRASEKSLQAAEHDYWDTAAGFLTPMQVAKLFLKGHPKK